VSAKFKAEILILCQPDITALVIDLSNVKAIDSSGLGALLLAHRQLKDHNIPIALIGVNENVQTLLDISQLIHLFEYYDTVDEAIEDYA
jgi:anti-anti-sigma factor